MKYLIRKSLALCYRHETCPHHWSANTVVVLNPSYFLSLRGGGFAAAASPRLRLSMRDLGRRLGRPRQVHGRGHASGERPSDASAFVAIGGYGVSLARAGSIGGERLDCWRRSCWILGCRGRVVARRSSFCAALTATYRGLCRSDARAAGLPRSSKTCVGSRIGSPGSILVSGCSGGQPQHG